MTKVICINGFKRSGKNEVGMCITDLTNVRGLTTKQVAFADKLKIAAAKALGFDRPDAELIALMDSFKEGATISMLYDEPDRPSTPFAYSAAMHQLTGRQYLQWFGTEVGRDLFGNDFWVDQVLPYPSTFPQAEVACQVGPRIVGARYGHVDYLAITDCRFINEASRALALGGEVWEILRPETDAEGDHASEKRLPRELITRQILNDGTLADLQAKVAEALGL